MDHAYLAGAMLVIGAGPAGMQGARAIWNWFRKLLVKLGASIEECYQSNREGEKWTSRNI
jgi:hypothetical protein